MRGSLSALRDESLLAARKILENASPNDAVLLTHFNTETQQDIFHEYNDIAYQIGHFSQPPVFVFWSFYITNGVLGGYVTNSHQLGVSAVELLMNQLKGASYQPLNLKNVEGYILDYQAMKDKGIDASLVPPQATLLGKPASFISANWKILLVLGSTIGALVLIILVLVLLLQRKRKINQQSQEIVELQQKTVNVQKDLIYLLGDAIETRSGETGNHVKRVAKMSALLAGLAGLTEDDCERLEVVSPMHDIGKIGIPEAILDKPGKLTPEEWKIMQTHVEIGFKILDSSDGNILHEASIIALEHHERWDGTGYPAGKSGIDIHIFARITSLVDVFDALLSERCYKKPWPIADVVTLFKEQPGPEHTLINC